LVGVVISKHWVWVSACCSGFNKYIAGRSPMVKSSFGKPDQRSHPDGGAATAAV
jgi:hypothetical protein